MSKIKNSQICFKKGMNRSTCYKLCVFFLFHIKLPFERVQAISLSTCYLVFESKFFFFWSKDRWHFVLLYSKLYYSYAKRFAQTCKVDVPGRLAGVFRCRCMNICWFVFLCDSGVVIGIFDIGVVAFRVWYSVFSFVVRQGFAGPIPPTKKKQQKKTDHRFVQKSVHFIPLFLFRSG